MGCAVGPPVQRLIIACRRRARQRPRASGTSVARSLGPLDQWLRQFAAPVIARTGLRFSDQAAGILSAAVSDKGCAMPDRGDAVSGPNPRAGRAFSLIELLLAVAIAGLLVLAAGPTYRHWIAAQELSNHAHFLAGTLNL